MNSETETRVRKHGLLLLAIFPKASIQDPVKLCRALRRHEGSLERLALALCNGETDDIDHAAGIIMERVQRLLVSTRVWFNRDPRGYALKMDLAAGETLHRDMGGYGIIAPDLSESD